MNTSCTGVAIEDYADSTPTLDLRQFFNGELRAYGILQNRGGTVTRKFSATIQAHWQGDIGTLDEVFYFDDGEVSTRVWTLRDVGDGSFVGTAGDVVGEARGALRGATFHWVYTLAIPYRGSTLNVKLDDWLYLVTEDRLINRTRLKKFGFEVGQLTLVIEK